MGGLAPGLKAEALRWRGFEACQLENLHLRATFVPQLGGKLVSLLHKASMREWLWRNPHLEPAMPVYGASYVAKHDLGGWDECFPTIAPCPMPAEPWSQVALPDHGELWALPWRSELRQSPQGLELRMVTHGVRLPYRFERWAWLDPEAPTLRLAYRVENLTPFPMPFLWCAHPLLATSPGMRLELPEEGWRVHGAPGGRFGSLGSPQRLPVLVDAAGALHSVDPLPGPEAGLAVKLWAPSPASGVVAVVDPAMASRLELRFDPNEVTHLGLWLNLGGWAGVPGATPYHNLGLEPGLGMPDDLYLTERHGGGAPVLPALGRRSWQLELALATVGAS